MCLARSLQTARPAIERLNESKNQDQDGQHDDSPLHRTPIFKVSSHRGVTSPRSQNLNFHVACLGKPGQDLIRLVAEPSKF